jgi:prolipoprotein diacylglyceryltransferase
MSGALMIGVMALGLAALFAWAFRHLPRERWQILAVLPREHEQGGGWRGTNLSYYGVFNALAMATAVAVAVFLPGSVGLPLGYLTGCVLAFLTVVLPASKLVNRMVEGHWHGFTVGGGCFVGMVAGPWVIWGVSILALPPGDAVSAVSFVLGALAPAYALGEGIGRLACISFGCCYGRPLADSPAWLQKLFGPWAFVFEGRLKKASYAHGYQGQRLIPVQALTAVISSLAGLAGVALFLSGRPVAAFVLAIVATQVWRFLSEFLRADYRGAGRISAYQWMALAGTGYTVLFGLLWPAVPRTVPDVARGLALLWTPGAIVLIEVVALFVLLRMGVSTVTTSHITLDLRHDRIKPVEEKHSGCGSEDAHGLNARQT